MDYSPYARFWNLEGLPMNFGNDTSFGYVMNLTLQHYQNQANQDLEVDGEPPIQALDASEVMDLPPLRTARAKAMVKDMMMGVNAIRTEHASCSSLMPQLDSPMIKGLAFGLIWSPLPPPMPEPVLSPIDLYKINLAKKNERKSKQVGPGCLQRCSIFKNISEIDAESLIKGCPPEKEPKKNCPVRVKCAG